MGGERVIRVFIGGVDSGNFRDFDSLESANEFVGKQPKAKFCGWDFTNSAGLTWTEHGFELDNNFLHQISKADQKENRQ